jgi:hypothetical protein
VLLADGSQPLTADWDAGEFDITALSFIASGPSPSFVLERALDTQSNVINFNEADGSVRWKIEHAGTGDDNDFSVKRYNASGVLQDVPLLLDGVTGLVTTLDVAFSQGVYLTGVITPTQLSANTDDWAPTGFADANTVRVSSDAARNLTGIAGGSAGRMIVLHNVGSYDITLVDDATSTAANRFALAENHVMGPDTSVTLVYDGTSSRWRVQGARNRTAQQLADEIGPLYAEPLVVQGRLNYTNSTTLSLDVFKGNRVPLWDGTRWVYRTIVTPPTISNSGLGNFDTVNIYAYWTGSAIALEKSATAWTTDGDGMPYKTGDKTRLLVGKAATNGSGVFASSLTERLTVSYWNRVEVACLATQASFAQTNTSVWENLGSQFFRFVCFNGDYAEASIDTTASSATAASMYCGIGVNSQTAPASYSGNSCASGGPVVGSSATVRANMTEGLHYVAAIYNVSTASTWAASYLHGKVNG